MAYEPLILTASAQCHRGARGSAALERPRRAAHRTPRRLRRPPLPRSPFGSSLPPPDSDPQGLTSPAFAGYECPPPSLDLRPRTSCRKNVVPGMLTPIPTKFPRTNGSLRGQNGLSEPASRQSGSLPFSAARPLSARKSGWAGTRAVREGMRDLSPVSRLPARRHGEARH